mmetsp:Transcript_12671/g.41289  ORF Transcript_12671/g.41289 Transcript_12671/m.41289 type:complete len:219 (+) Transcript_12671:391-1047(+)
MFSRARLRLKRAPLLGEGGGFPLLEEEELEVLLRPTPAPRRVSDSDSVSDSDLSETCSLVAQSMQLPASVTVVALAACARARSPKERDSNSRLSSESWDARETGSRPEIRLRTGAPLPTAATVAAGRVAAAAELLASAWVAEPPVAVAVVAAGFPKVWATARVQAGLRWPVSVGSRLSYQWSGCAPSAPVESERTPISSGSVLAQLMKLSSESNWTIA